MSEISTQISVTRALAEIKHLGDRIPKALAGGMFVGVSAGKGDAISVLQSAEKVSTIEDRIKSSWQSIEDLMLRRDKLKKLIIASNAVTKIKIGTEDMTVAEAIELKSSIAFKKAFLQTLNNQYAGAVKLHEGARAELERKIEVQLNNLSSGDKNKLNQDSTKTVTEQLRQQFEPALIDPKSIKAAIDKLENEILTFEQEVDFALSESNAKTTITV